MGSCEFWWGLIGSDVILNAVKNLSGCNKGCAIPEILRSAQDDRRGGTEVGAVGVFLFSFFRKPYVSKKEKNVIVVSRGSIEGELSLLI